MVRGAGIQDVLLARLPGDVRAGLAGAVAGFFTMVALSALAFVASIVVHFGVAVRVAEGLDAGVVGGLVLALVGLAAVPNAVLCAGAYLAGPGFVLGTGSTVTPSEVHLGLLPSLPVLAATPRGAGPWWVELLLLTPVAAGAVAGVVTVRRMPAPSLLIGTAAAASAGAVGGIAFAAVTWLATGAIGPGRMQDIGPRVVETGVVCTVGFTLGAAIAAVCWLWWGGRSDGSDEPVPDQTRTDPDPA